MSVHAKESRDFRSYHAFLRAARNYMEGPLVGQMHDSYERACEQRGLTGEQTPKDWRAAEAVLDHLRQGLRAVDPDLADDLESFLGEYRQLFRIARQVEAQGELATAA